MSVPKHRFARPTRSAFKSSHGPSRRQSRLNFDPEASSGGHTNGKAYREAHYRSGPGGGSSLGSGADSFSPFNSQQQNSHNFPVSSNWPYNTEVGTRQSRFPSFINHSYQQPPSFANPYNPQNPSDAQQPSANFASVQSNSDNWDNLRASFAPLPAENLNAPTRSKFGFALPKQQSPPSAADLMSQYSFAPYISTQPSYQTTSNMQTLYNDGRFQQTQVSSPAQSVNSVNSVRGVPYADPASNASTRPSAPSTKRSWFDRFRSRPSTETAPSVQEIPSHDPNAAVPQYFLDEITRRVAEGIDSAQGQATGGDSAQNLPANDMNSNFGSSLGQGTISSSGMRPSFSQQLPLNQMGNFSLDSLRSLSRGSSVNGPSGASFQYIPLPNGQYVLQTDLDVSQVVGGMMDGGRETLTFHVDDKFNLTVSIKDGKGPHTVNAIVPDYQHRGQFSSYPTNPQQTFGTSGINPDRDFPTASSRRNSTLGYWGNDIASIDWNTKFNTTREQIKTGPQGVHMWAIQGQSAPNEHDYKERLSLFSQCQPFTAQCLTDNDKFDPQSLPPSDQATFYALNALMADCADLQAPWQQAYSRVYQEAEKIFSQGTGVSQGPMSSAPWASTAASLWSPSSTPGGTGQSNTNQGNTTSWGNTTGWGGVPTTGSRPPGDFDASTAQYVISHFNSLPDDEKERYRDPTDNTLSFYQDQSSWVTRGKDHTTMTDQERAAVRKLQETFNSAMSTLKSTHTAPTDKASIVRGEQAVASYVDNGFREYYLLDHSKRWDDVLSVVEKSGWTNTTRPPTKSYLGRATNWMWENPAATLSGLMSGARLASRLI